MTRDVLVLTQGGKGVCQSVILLSHSLSDSNCVHMIDEYKVEPLNMKGIQSLKAIQKGNLDRIVIAYLNINS